MSYVMTRCPHCFSSSGGCTGACRPPNNQQIGFADVVLKGCVCPPTSEQTCQRWDCGRKSAVGVRTGYSTTTPNTSSRSGE